jgi:hypothetical protein
MPYSDKRDSLGDLRAFSSFVGTPNSRALTVVKARGSAHDPFTRQYEITSDGVILDDHFERNQNLT